MRYLLFTCVAALILNVAAVGRNDSTWEQPVPGQCETLYCWTDTCNTYVLKDGDAAILIDLGDGSVLSHLDEIGVTRIDWILFTHHHREQCHGFGLLQDSDVKTAAPQTEKEFFEKPTSFRKMKPNLDDPFTVYGASYVRPPLESIPIDKALKTGDVFTWRAYELRCMETPGHSPGSMTYGLECGSQLLVFSGDVMLDGARMHTWFDSEWDYGFAKGLDTLIASVDRLVGEKPDILLPSHGPTVTDPTIQLADYAQKLRELQKRYVRGYPVFSLKDQQRDPLSRPTVVPEIFQVTPHLYKFNRPGEGSNFSITVADSGRAIISDCGLMSSEYLDRALTGMQQHLGLKKIDAMIISHMHGDHFLLGEHLRNKYGTQIWTLDRIADKCEHPERYDYAAMIQSYNSGVDSLTIDRRLRDGEVVEWEGYRLQVDWMPGQTEFGCCLWLELDGKRVAFTGDNIFGDPSDPNQDGHEAVVARNSAIFEEGYLYAASYLKKLQPDLLMGGHSFVMPEPAAFIDRYHQWAQDIIRMYQDLLPGPDYRYRFDPYWVKAEPYRVTLEPGQSTEVQVVVRNFRNQDQHHYIKICTPPGIAAQPAVLEGIVNGVASQSFPVRLSATPDVPPGVNIAAFDITLDGERYGQWFDMIVQVVEPVTLSIAGEPINRTISSGHNDVVYLAPAAEPYEALPLGNGQLGVMLRNAPGMNYLFHQGSFFANADQDNDLISSGEFSLDLPKTWRQGFVDQRLALHDAMIVTRYNTGNDTHTIKSWLAEGLDLMVVEIESTSALPDLAATLSVWERDIGSEATAGQNDIGLATVGVGAHRATALAARALDSEITTSAKGREATMKIPAKGAKRLSLLVACPVVIDENQTFESIGKAAREVVSTAQAKGIDVLWTDHTNYWHTFWNKSGMLMHSEDGLADYVENLYHLHLYWMAGCSRGPEAPKFNGGNYLFCNDWRSWGGYYWYQNTRELFWSLPAANHTELMKPLVDLYVNNLPAAQKLARELFNAPGACFEETMGRLGHGDKRNNAYTCLYNATGTEIARQLYHLYQFNHDEAYLRDKVYTVLKEVLTFQMSFLHREDDGLYHVYPSNARETYWWIRDSISDLTALRAMLPVLIHESERLGLDADQRDHWRDVLANLTPFPADEADNRFLPGVFLDEFPPTPYARPEQLYPVGQNRTLKSKGNAFNYENVDCEPVWPWGLIGIDSPATDYSRACRTFYKRRHNEWTYGNAWDWSSLIAARLGLSDEVVKCMQQYVRNVQEFPSGFPGTPGNAPKCWGGQIGDSPGLDAAGVLPTAIQEIQLQSYGGVIRVFPAWPKGWQSEFTLMAEGGFLVSSRIGEDSQIPEVRIQCTLGGPCTVVNPWPGGANVNGPSGRQSVTSSARITCETKLGDVYVFRPVTKVAESIAIPVSRNDGPKWPFHQGTGDTIESYIKRTDSFGMLGIARDGQNLTRNKVQRALVEQTKVKEPK